MTILKSTYPTLKPTAAGANFNNTNGQDLLNLLCLPPIVEDFADLNRGLVIISGSMATGKTTTVNSMIKIINHKKPSRHSKRITTFEDPIEYRHENNKATISQYELGEHFMSLSEAFGVAFWDVSDIVVFSELRSPEAASAVLDLLDRGYFVITTMHSATTTSTIERFIDMFPRKEQREVQERLAESLKAVISQKLLRVDGEQRRVLATEILTVDNEISNAIKSDDLESIRKALDADTLENSVSMDTSMTFLSETFDF